MIEWQSIDTAPTDGSMVLLFVDWIGRGSIQPGYFRTWVGKGWVKVNATTKKYGDLAPQSEWCHPRTKMPISDFAKPTHWAPFVDLSPNKDWDGLAALDEQVAQ